MKIIVCVDKNNGIMFNKRRISKDSKVVEDILKMVQNQKIICSTYSSTLFENYNINIEINDNYKINGNDYYFFENNNPNFDYISEIIIYNWNRNYPSDTKFTYSLENLQLKEMCEIEGTSHEKIAKYVYERNN